MSRETIPESIEITCDICYRKIRGDVSYKRNGRILIQSSGLNNLGEPCCNGNRSLDVCDECLEEVVDAIANLQLGKK